MVFKSRRARDQLKMENGKCIGEKASQKTKIDFFEWQLQNHRCFRQICCVSEAKLTMEM